MNDGWDLSSSDPIKSGREILSLKAHPPEAITATRNALICTHTHTHSLRWASLFSFSIFINLLLFFFYFASLLSLWGEFNSIVFHLLANSSNNHPTKKRWRNPTVRGMKYSMYIPEVLCKCNCQVQVLHFLFVYTTIEMVAVVVVFLSLF